MKKIKIASTSWIFAPGFFRWIREAVAPFDKPKAAELLRGLGLEEADAKFLSDPANKVEAGQDGEDLTLEFTTT